MFSGNVNRSQSNQYEKQRLRIYAFAIFKLLVKPIKNQPLSEIVADSDFNETMKRGNREQCVQIQLQRFDSQSLKCKVLVLLQTTLNYNNSFIEDVNTIKEASI